MLSDDKRRRLEKNKKDLEQLYELQSEKINNLRNAKIIETDPSRKFEYEHQIKNEETELKKLEDRLDDIEKHLQSAQGSIPVLKKESLNVNEHEVEQLSDIPVVGDEASEVGANCTDLQKVLTNKVAEAAYEEIDKINQQELPLEKWKCVKTISVHGLYKSWSCNDNRISIAITPDSQTLISASNDNKVTFWDVETGDIIKSIENINEDSDFLSFGEPLLIKLSSDGKFLASVRKNILYIWNYSNLFNLDNCEPISVIKIKTQGEYNRITAFSFSYDSELLAISSGEKIDLYLLGVPEGVRHIKTLCPFDEEEYFYKNNVDYYNEVYNDDYDDYDDYYIDQISKFITCIAFNRKQEFQIAAGFSYWNDDQPLQANIIIWDRYTGKIIKKLQGHSGTTSSIDFGLDGKTLVSIGTIDKEVKTWSLETFKNSSSFRGHYDIANIICSPVEPIIASGGKDGIINIYHLGNGKKLHSLKDHQFSIDSIIFSIDGKLLISSSGDSNNNIGEIKLWKVI